MEVRLVLYASGGQSPAGMSIHLSAVEQALASTVLLHCLRDRVAALMQSKQTCGR
jgi:hypothetical protein